MERKIGKQAKRKTATKKTSKRRRSRVSGVSSKGIEGMAMNVLGVATGAVVAREANNIQTSMGLGLSAGVMGLIQIGAGFAASVFFKNKFIQDMGMGMATEGVLVELIDNFAIISGIGGAGSMRGRTLAYKINGTSNLSVLGRINRFPGVGGTSNLSVLGNTGQNRLQNPQYAQRVPKRSQNVLF
jgi:hypothetical protein